MTEDTEVSRRRQVFTALGQFLSLTISNLSKELVFVHFVCSPTHMKQERGDFIVEKLFHILWSIVEGITTRESIRVSRQHFDSQAVPLRKMWWRQKKVRFMFEVLENDARPSAWAHSHLLTRTHVR